MKSSNLRHFQAHSQSKGLSDHQRRASWLRTGPCPLEAGRQAGDIQSRKARGNLSLRDGIPYQTAKRLPIANQDFLGCWTVDIRQEGGSQRSVLQKRHTEHLRQCSQCTPEKLSSWDQRGDKTHHPTWKECALQAPGRLSCLDLERVQTTGQTESVPLWST